MIALTLAKGSNAGQTNGQGSNRYFHSFLSWYSGSNSNHLMLFKYNSVKMKIVLRGGTNQVISRAAPRSFVPSIPPFQNSWDTMTPSGVARQAWRSRTPSRATYFSLNCVFVKTRLFLLFRKLKGDAHLFKSPSDLKQNGTQKDTIFWHSFPYPFTRCVSFCFNW